MREFLYLSKMYERGIVCLLILVRWGCVRGRFIALSAARMNAIRLLSSLYLFCVENTSVVGL